MTPEQIKLVQTSFESVKPIAPQAAALFYDRLFEIAPDVRALFPADLTDQKQKLMSMIAVAVDNLHQVEQIVPAVQDLGRRHATYGVRAAHYQSVGEALICDTQAQAERFVALFHGDAPAAIGVVNAEQHDPSACAIVNVAYVRGPSLGTARNHDDAFQIVRILVVGVASENAIRTVRPAAYFTLRRVKEFAV